MGNITWYIFQEEEEDNKIIIFQLGKEMVGLIFKLMYKACGFNIKMNTSIPEGAWRQGKALLYRWRLQNTKWGDQDDLLCSQSPKSGARTSQKDRVSDTLQSPASLLPP